MAYRGGWRRARRLSVGHRVPSCLAVYPPAAATPLGGPTCGGNGPSPSITAALTGGRLAGSRESNERAPRQTMMFRRLSRLSALIGMDGVVSAPLMHKSVSV